MKPTEVTLSLNRGDVLLLISALLVRERESMSNADSDRRLGRLQYEAAHYLTSCRCTELIERLETILGEL